MAAALVEGTPGTGGGPLELLLAGALSIVALPLYVASLLLPGALGIVSLPLYVAPLLLVVALGSVALVIVRRFAFTA